MMIIKRVSKKAKQLERQALDEAVANLAAKRAAREAAKRAKRGDFGDLLGGREAFPVDPEAILEGDVVLWVVQARGLKTTEDFGKSDPYVSVRYHGKKVRKGGGNSQRLRFVF